MGGTAMEYNFDDQDGLDQSSSKEPGWSMEVAPSSDQSAAGEEGVVNYFFPVEIVVAGSLVPQEREIIQAQIYQDLHEAIIDKLT
jgi:hypothetical protein